MRLRRRSDEASCREVSRVLQAYLDGQVDELSARRVARHLDACRRCGLEAEVYARIKDSVGRMDRDVSSLPVARLRDFARRLADEGPQANEPPA
ncbi:MAG: zf-HC2 domain-containing protein [Actinomycetota bacterium]|nr:zf-HC2 domain-containing protein [Actinomycetota bacterium]